MRHSDVFACRLGRAAFLAAGIVYGAGCDGDDGVTLPGPPITFDASPASLALRVGDTTSVRLTVQSPSPATIQRDWSSMAPEVAVVEAVTSTGDGVRVRAVSAGRGSINFRIVQDGQTVTGSLPVTVTAAP